MNKLVVNEWVLEDLSNKGIKIKDGKFLIEFHKGQIQEVGDLKTALRQQQHIIDQQTEEKDVNEEIGKLMSKFHSLVLDLKKMTIKEFTQKRKDSTLKKLSSILEEMKRKREDLRKDGYARLCKVFKMVERDNLPAANTSSLAALDRMRKRWFVNNKIIEKSHARLMALQKL
jgi:hypothetical protein